MRLFRVEGWLESPLDRDVIARWTLGEEGVSRHDLALPQPPDPADFTLLALGDTGDSEAAGPYLSPQDAVARELVADIAGAEPDKPIAAVLHMGDVVYMTGERRCYERNFRRPYRALLTPESTVDNLTFRLPFLPVPGNHDYYDLGVWAKALSRVPLLGPGLRALGRQIFAFSLPLGGSGMGGVYMRAFVDSNADTRSAPLPYISGSRTRLPNRYYQAQIGSLDLFALDSTTLEAPSPGISAQSMKADAGVRLQLLERRAEALEAQIRKEQRALEDWRTSFRDKLVREPARMAEIRSIVTATIEAISALAATLQEALPQEAARHTASTELGTVQRRWAEAATDLEQETDPGALVTLIQTLDEASDSGCAALDEVEQCLAQLPEGEHRTRLLDAHERLVQALHDWSLQVTQAPLELSHALSAASDEMLDLQREIADERRRMRYRPEDYDRAQIEWLDRSLTESIRLRPDSWRVVMLHHPLYTTIGNHCERPDVLGLRENLLALLKDRAHLVLAGHAHAFEWLRTEAAPNTAFCITGGGGALSLRPSILDPRRLYRHRDRYESLRRAGVVECISAGRGPTAPDGETGNLYHFLQLDITAEVLTIRPCGIRRMSASYRREQPLPVFHATSFGPERPIWRRATVDSIVIHRNAPPEIVWGAPAQ